MASHGGQIIVSPSTDAEVIEATVEAGLVSAPGYFTPSEAFLAIRAGAHALKLFPAEAASPKVVKAQRAVWPSHIPQIVVGGVTTDTMADYLAAGADRSEEHTSELQALMRISYAVFCLKKEKN